jgi:hypothetical protein
VVLLDGWPSERTEHGKEESGDILHVREGHVATRLRVDLELARAGKSPPTFPCQQRRRSGISRVNLRELPSWESPWIEGTDGFHSCLCRSR